MNNRIILCVVAIVLTVSCTKDKFTSKPQLFFKSVNTTVLPNRSILTFSLQFTDREGDVGDTLFINRNSKICPNSVNKNLTTLIPKFPTTSFQDGVFELNFAYNISNAGYPIINSCSNRSDTSIFRFWIKDKAGNISDTLNSPAIVFQP